MACFKYDSEADLIALGGCFAARCANVLAILQPLLLALLESNVKVTRPPSSSTRLARRLMSMIVCRAQGCGSCISVSTSLDLVTISALRCSVLERMVGRSFNIVLIAQDAASASVRYLPSGIALDFHPSLAFHAIPTPKRTSLAVSQTVLSVPDGLAASARAAAVGHAS